MNQTEQLISQVKTTIGLLNDLVCKIETLSIGNVVTQDVSIPTTIVSRQTRFEVDKSIIAKWKKELGFGSDKTVIRVLYIMHYIVACDVAGAYTNKNNHIVEMLHLNKIFDSTSAEKDGKKQRQLVSNILAKLCKGGWLVRGKDCGKQYRVYTTQKARDLYAKFPISGRVF